MTLGTHGAQFQYASLLTFAALEQGDTFKKSELFIATSSLPADGLHEAAQTLVRALEGAGEQRAQYWRNRILPYLKSIWPKSKDIITPSISESFARLCIVAKDDFPDALKELKRWLKPLEYPDFIVNMLHEAELCRRFPTESLVFLDVLIDNDTQWLPDDLEECLEEIEDALHGLKNDDRFKRLREYLRRHDFT